MNPWIFCCHLMPKARSYFLVLCFRHFVLLTCAYACYCVVVCSLIFVRFSVLYFFAVFSYNKHTFEKRHKVVTSVLVCIYGSAFASKMTFIVSGGALNSTHSLTVYTACSSVRAGLMVVLPEWKKERNTKAAKLSRFRARDIKAIDQRKQLKSQSRRD